MEVNPTLHDIRSIDDIKILIDAFYHKVRADELIGPIFNEIARVNWEHHLPKMYAFWEFLLIGGESYQGNPMEPHRRLNQKVQLKKEFFDRWVELFRETVDEHFSGIVAEEAKNKAVLIAMTWIPKFEQKI
jgi:hemoglobin